MRSHLHDDIQRLHGTMPLWGVDRWVSLGELFVDVNILEELSSSCKSELDDLWQDFSKNPSYRSLDRVGLGKERKRVSGLEEVAKNTNLIVVGKPGSGKTTYLQRVVTECNAGNLQAQRIPVLIKLRDFVKDGCEVAYALKPYLEKCWQLSDIETLLKPGRVLVLLDGLDEVTGEEGKNIAKEIKQFARAYPQVQVVVTCRTQSFTGEMDWKSLRFQFVEVADFNENQVRAFAEHWFKAVMEDESAGLAKSKEFLELLFLEANQPIRELAITPILLSLTCTVFHQTGKFYSKRSKLYEEGLELLLEQWDKSREIERDEIYRDLSVERKLELLSYLAVKKFEQPQYVLFEQTEIEGYIAEFLGIGQRDSQGVLRAMEAQHGLLIERAQKVWSFSHLTFQEYLVAKWFCDQNNLKGLIKPLRQSHWHDILALAAEVLPNADVLLKLLKESINCLTNDPLGESFINWLSNKVYLVLTEAQAAPPPVALRAFYFETALGRDWLGHEWRYKNLTTRLGLDAIWIGSVWEFDRSLVNHFWEGLQFTDVNNREQLNHSIFDYSERFNINICQYASFNPNLKILEELRDRLPSSTMELELYLQWWQTDGLNWISSIAAIILNQRYMDVLFHIRLSKQQQETLRLYYRANWTLINCLNGNCTVSDELRRELEETLFLPIVEIEKRKREKLKF